MTDADRLRALTIEFLATVLDEEIALGELSRLVESVRQTIGERERGMAEYTPVASAPLNAAAAQLFDRLLTPWTEEDHDRTWERDFEGGPE